MLASTPRQLVVLMDGHACGIGASIFLNAPYVVCTESSSVEFPESAYGFIPSAGSIFFLSKLYHNLGQYLAYTGIKLSGADL